jgi:hypothetical protein
MTSLRRSVRLRRMNHSGARKIVSLLHTKELRPRHVTVPASPRPVASPEPARSLPEFLEAKEVANNPVIPIVASQLLRELLVLFVDRSVQILSAPLRQRCERTLESVVRRLPFDHPYASLRSSPVVGKSQKVECPGFGRVPFLDFGVVGLGPVMDVGDLAVGHSGGVTDPRRARNSVRASRSKSPRMPQPQMHAPARDAPWARKKGTKKGTRLFLCTKPTSEAIKSRRI